MASDKAAPLAGERGSRVLTGGWDVLVRILYVSLPVLMIAYALHVPSEYFGMTVWREQVGLTVLGIALSASFLIMPFRAGDPGTGKPPIYDVILALLAGGFCFYTVWKYPALMSEGYAGFFDGGWLMVIISTGVVVMILEVIRRFTGWPLVILVLFFIGYGLTANMWPGILGGRRSDFDALMLYLYMDTSSMLGTPISVVVSVVFGFILLGSALFGLGGGQMFLDMALASMGRFRGGPAKAAVVASSLFGSVSGSAVANVATTGIVTIPLMKSGGFKPERAGAAEAVASTGGQLLPPIMGAAAFIMAEFLDVRYAEIALAALFPALLFYFAVFVQIHFAARKAGMEPLPADQRPSMVATLKFYWPFLLPVAVLIYFLFFTAQQAQTAAILSVAAVFVASFVRKETRPGWRKMLGVFESCGKNLLDLIAIVAAAGFIIGVLSVTALGFSLGLGILQASGGNVVILLLMTAVAALILGMGMPTTAVYILMATMIAPALIKAGINPVAAHLFVLYYGVLSMITPPICLASFTAASIARANLMQTGWESVRLGFVTFLVPMLFVSSPALLLQGDSTFDIVRALATGFAGCVFVAAGFEGFIVRVLNQVERTIAFIAGVMLMLPEGQSVSGFWTGYSDKLGAAIAALLLLWLFTAGRRAAGATAQAE